MLILRKLVNQIKPGIVDLKKLAKARSGVASVFQINQNLQIGIQGNLNRFLSSVYLQPAANLELLW